MEPVHVQDSDNDELSVLELAIVFAKHKRLVLGVPAIAGAIATVIALLLPNMYTAKATLLPPQQKESSAASMLGALAGVAGGGTGAAVGQALGLKNPNDLYVGILGGRTIADRLIQRFNLQALYEENTLVKTREALAEITSITAGKDGLIAIEVTDEDPQRAADIANAYIEELDRLMQRLAVTEAAQRRLFFEKQLSTTRDQLLAAEMALREAIQTKGITGVETQSRAIVGTAEQLRAQISLKEVQLNAMKAFATERNPEAIRLSREIGSLKAELAQLEGGGRGSADSTPPPGLENIRKLREVKFLEFTLELLTKQYEMARIDEAKDTVLIQVADRAVAPDYKSKPKRALIVIATTLIAGIAAAIAAILKEALQRARMDPISEARLNALRKYLSFR